MSSERRNRWLASPLFLLFVMVGMTHAQTCGDADGSGTVTVTVTDGVGVLRHVAGLSSACAGDPTRCDLDGDGSVSVTDGVNVLRHVAGLSAPLSCPGGVIGVARFAGTYQGTFSGEDEGDFDVEIYCDGDIEGFGYSSLYDEDFDVFGTARSDGNLTLTVGATSDATSFRGTIREDGSISGTWSNRLYNEDGSFRGSRTNFRSCQ